MDLNENHLGSMGIDWGVAMIEGAGLVTERLISHKTKTSWCSLDKLVTEMLETSVFFVFCFSRKASRSKLGRFAGCRSQNKGFPFDQLYSCQ